MYMYTYVHSYCVYTEGIPYIGNYSYYMSIEIKDHKFWRFKTHLDNHHSSKPGCIPGKVIWNAECLNFAGQIFCVRLEIRYSGCELSLPIQQFKLLCLNVLLKIYQGNLKLRNPRIFRPAKLSYAQLHRKRNGDLDQQPTAHSLCRSAMRSHYCISKAECRRKSHPGQSVSHSVQLSVSRDARLDCRLPGLGFSLSSSRLGQVMNFEYISTSYYNRPSLLCRCLLLLKELMYLLPCACVTRKNYFCALIASVRCQLRVFRLFDLARQMPKFKRISMPGRSMIFHISYMVYFRSFNKRNV